jgi:hypothetical protein
MLVGPMEWRGGGQGEEGSQLKRGHQVLTLGCTQLLDCPHRLATAAEETQQTLRVSTTPTPHLSCGPRTLCASSCSITPSTVSYEERERVASAAQAACCGFYRFYVYAPGGPQGVR